MVWLAGAMLNTINWTRAEGEPLRVSVIQGNIEQSIKWKQHMKQPTLNLYQRLTLEQHEADLVIWPETAIPDYRHRMQSYIKRLQRKLEQRDTELIFGIFIKQDGRLLNSAINTRGDAYSKRHLVPLGEYIPFRSLVAFFNRFVKIPMSDIASGDEDQPLMVAHGVPLGISICFEEASFWSGLATNCNPSSISPDWSPRSSRTLRRRREHSSWKRRPVVRFLSLPCGWMGSS
jgi:apolipoprotein N-acyltransferase